MRKALPVIAAIALGLCFLMASVPILFDLMKMPHLPTDTPAGQFNMVFWSTGYVKFVKIFEFTGGIVVMIPRLRNVGLLLLGPVIVNILGYNILIDDPHHLLNFKFMWMLYVVVVCALYLLWNARQKFSNLLN